MNDFKQNLLVCFDEVLGDDLRVCLREPLLGASLLLLVLLGEKVVNVPHDD